MKAFFMALFILGLMPALPPAAFAQVPVDEAAPVARFSREEITELVGPIALYPDPLVALILPASTFPSDVVLASRFLDSGEDIAQADEKPWDSSVVGLVRYPATLKWMDENLEWTTQLGDAYLTQPEDVMDAIQQLRAQAASVGNLVDTPQQTVVEDDSCIRIVPADPEYIYVPCYDPEVVFYERPVSVPLLTFSVGCEAGPWLRYDCDWHHRRLYCGEWHRGWDYGRDRDRDGHHGDNAFINRHLTNARVWHGDSGRRLASTHLLAQTRVARERDHSVARPEHFSERSQHRDSIPRALSVEGNNFRGPSSSAKPSLDVNRGDQHGRGRFVLPNSAAPSMAGRSENDDNHFRGDPRSRQHGDETKGNIPRALPLHVDGKDHVSSGRAPSVPSIAGSGTHDNNDRFHGDPRAHAQNSDAARIAAATAVARSRAEVNHAHARDNTAGTGGRDFTSHAVINPQQAPSVHRDVPRAGAAASVERPTPVIRGRVEHSMPQAHLAPQVQPQQHVAPQIQRSEMAARIQHSTPQVHVAPQVQRAMPQHTPMAAHVEHSAPPQPRSAPQVQRSAPPAPQGPQTRSAPSHGNGSNDDSHKRRH